MGGGVGVNIRKLHFISFKQQWTTKCEIAGLTYSTTKSWASLNDKFNNSL